MTKWMIFIAQKWWLNARFFKSSKWWLNAWFLNHQNDIGMQDIFHSDKRMTNAWFLYPKMITKWMNFIAQKLWPNARFLKSAKWYRNARYFSKRQNDD